MAEHSSRGILTAVKKKKTKTYLYLSVLYAVQTNSPTLDIFPKISGKDRLSFIFYSYTITFQMPSVRNKILCSYRRAIDDESIFRKGDTKLKLQGIILFKMVLGNVSAFLATPKDKYMTNPCEKEQCLAEEICILGNLLHIKIPSIA